MDLTEQKFTEMRTVPLAYHRQKQPSVLLTSIETFLRFVQLSV